MSISKAEVAAMVKNRVDFSMFRDITGGTWGGENYSAGWKFFSICFAMIHLNGDVVFLDRRDAKFCTYSRAAMATKLEACKYLDESGGKKKISPFFLHWLRSEGKYEYWGEQFCPDPDKADADAYNHFRGFAAKEVEGDWSQNYAFIRDIICAGNAEYFEFVLDWIADLWQNPGRKSGVALILLGLKGIGKTYFSDQIAEATGHEYCPVIDSPESLNNNFNRKMERALLAQVEEGYHAANPSHESKIKHLITGSRLEITPKGVDSYMAPSYVRIIVTSNSPHVIPATEGERRYFVLEVPPTRIRDGAYFRRLKAEMDAGGREAMMFDLMRRDISKRDFSRVPNTAGLTHQIIAGYKGEDRWLFDLLDSGRLSFVRRPEGVDEGSPIPYAPRSAANDASTAKAVADKPHPLDWTVDGPWTVDADLLYASYVQHCPGFRSPPGQAQLGRFLSSALKVTRGKRPRSEGRKPTYVLPSLVEARQAYVAARTGLSMAIFSEPAVDDQADADDAMVDSEADTTSDTVVDLALAA